MEVSQPARCPGHTPRARNLQNRARDLPWGHAAVSPEGGRKITREPWSVGPTAWSGHTPGGSCHQEGATCLTAGLLWLGFSLTRSGTLSSCALYYLINSGGDSSQNVHSLGGIPGQFYEPHPLWTSNVQTCCGKQKNVCVEC